MDDRLVSWARAVKRRRQKVTSIAARAATSRAAMPILWLFTDPARQTDLLAAIGRLPGAPASPWLCGVIFRHDGVMDREALAVAAARLCRSRAIRFVVAGAPLRARGVGAYRHARGGRSPAALTASAHGMTELVRARRAGARLVFLSPVFPTASHDGAPCLGPRRWARLSLDARMSVAALGGISGHTVRRLPGWAAGAGAIAALS